MATLKLVLDEIGKLSLSPNPDATFNRNVNIPPLQLPQDPLIKPSRPLVFPTQFYSQESFIIPYKPEQKVVGVSIDIDCNRVFDTKTEGHKPGVKPYSKPELQEFVKLKGYHKSGANKAELVAIVRKEFCT